ncbi:MAG: MOSC domain-containing protein [Candidatus Glassbacteria bacterium]|nr:MOSC domain-containing protein [Candidatus Glassbacteria bacterium]
MGNVQGKILAISVSDGKGVPKKNVEAARLVEDWGIEGDAHAGSGRQVSLLAAESIERIRQLGVEVKAGDFAENITTLGIDLRLLKPGDRIAAGCAVLEVTQIGKACHGGCRIYEQVGECAMPREGVFARVVSGGEIKPGDPVRAPAG